MDDAARRTYRGFGTFFLIVGGVFLGLGLLRAFVLPDVLDGNPLPVALVLVAIGFALHWTVRDRGEDATKDGALVEDTDEEPRDDA